MQEHPVPRQITTFEFKLIGELTIKQFGYLIFGAAFAVVFFFLVPNILFLNWLLAAVPAGAAIGLAFVPINERPMDIYMRNLFKRLTSPTQYFFKKNNLPPKILLGLVLPPREVMVEHLKAQQKLNEYLSTRPKSTTVAHAEQVDEARVSKTKNIQSLLASPRGTITQSFQVAAGAVAAPPAIPPQATPASVVAPSFQPLSSANPKEAVLSSPQRFTFRGTVVSGDGVPLPGILVYVRKGDKVIRLFKTDSEGGFINNLGLVQDAYTLECDDPNKKYSFDRLIVDGSKTSFEIFGH